jgi:hypothetical protein
MPCIRTRRLAARLLVDRSHYLSSCARSLCLRGATTRARIAPALLRLCRASGRAVSTLDFSSVGRTGFRRVSGHSVLCRDYSSRGRNAYTSPTPCVWEPRHLARLVARLVTRLVVDYFTYTACPGASACREARHMAHRRLLRLAQARTPRVHVPRHVVRLISPLVVDYFAYAARSGASARRAARRRLLRVPRLRIAATLALLQPCRASRLPVSRKHWLYFEYATHRRDIVFRSHHVEHSSRLVF